MSYQTEIQTDPTTLLIIKNEIDQIINQVKITIADFIKDPTLLDHIDNILIRLEQCTQVLAFIDQPQLSKIMQYSTELMQKIISNSFKATDAEVFTLNEALNIIQRYIEFSCLHEVKTPQLLLNILNSLEQTLKKPITTEAEYTQIPNNNILLNLKLRSVQTLGKSIYIHLLYKFTLIKILKQELSEFDVSALKLVGSYMAQLSTEQPSQQYWELMNEMCHHIHQLELYPSRRRTIIKIESNIRQYFQASENFIVTPSDFLNIISLCISLNTETSKKIRNQLNIADRILNDEQLKPFSHLLLAPNFETIKTLCDSITDKISQIQSELEFSQNAKFEKFKDLYNTVTPLESAFSSLNLSNAYSQLIDHFMLVLSSESLQDNSNINQLKDIIFWTLNSIEMVKCQHLPKQLQLQINNSNISLNALNEAYDRLLAETQNSIQIITQSLLKHLDEQNVQLLAPIPAALHKISATFSFLNQSTAQQALELSATFIQQQYQQQHLLDKSQINAIFDTLASTHLFIDHLKQKQPVIPTMFDVALENNQKLNFTASSL